MAKIVTIDIDGTGLAASWDDERYGDTPVWLHSVGENPFLGKPIGWVASMVGHGAYAMGGRTEPCSENTWRATYAFRTPYGQHLTRTEAVRLLVEWAQEVAA